jgi:hypothetical protein
MIAPVNLFPIVSLRIAALLSDTFTDEEAPQAARTRLPAPLRPLRHNASLHNSCSF